VPQPLAAAPGEASHNSRTAQKTATIAPDGLSAGAETPRHQPATGEERRQRSAAEAPVDWRPLLFQQFHDILPGTSIPEVFEQAEPEWRAARRQARRQRDLALLAGLGALPEPGAKRSAGQPSAASAAPAGADLAEAGGCASQAWPGDPTAPCPAPGGRDAGSGPQPASPSAEPQRAVEPMAPSVAPPIPPSPGPLRLHTAENWWAAQLHPLAAAPRCRRLPAGTWQLASGPHSGRTLQGQPARGGGTWVQLPLSSGVSALALRRTATAADGAAPPLPLEAPVTLTAEGEGRWRLDNGLVSARCGPAGLEELWDAAGQPLLGAPLRWCRWRDQGEFWDAWDLAPDHRDHPLDWRWQPGPAVQAGGPLCVELIWHGHCGDSPLRLTLRLLAGSPALELLLSVQWRQRHELLQLEIPLAAPQPRWAADCTGGVLERPAQPRTPREQARWEVTALSWVASAGLAVLLDGPQGVSAGPERLTVSLLRAPTWPDPGADNGWQRQRLALMPAPGGWRQAGVPQQARRLREPLWLHPAHLDAAAGTTGSDAAASGTTATHDASMPQAGPDAVIARTFPAPRTCSWPGFPDLGDDLRLVGLRANGPMAGVEPMTLPAQPTGEHPTLILTVQNEGPCRRRLRLPAPWRVLERIDGLDQPAAMPIGCDPLEIRPWELCCWRIDREPGA
jgi:alpha-mannosidase